MLRFILTVLPLLAIAVPPAPELHVDPVVGNDAALGTSAAAPLRTVRAARDRLRRLRAGRGGVLPGGARVLLHSGRHEPFVLDGGALDSGTPGAPVRYAAAPGERPLVSGGLEVPAAAFSPAQGRPGVFLADLAKLGLGPADFGTLPSTSTGQGCPQLQYLKMQLFHDGRRTTLARYPNLLPNGRWQFMHSGEGTSSGFACADTDEARVLGWVDEEAPYVQGYFTHEWGDEIRAIQMIEHNGSSVEVSIAGRGVGAGKRNARWVGLNLLSELDAEGEYFISRAGQLWYKPDVPPSEWEVPPVVSVKPTCINISGVSRVSIEGLAVAHCRGVGIEAGDTVLQPGGDAQRTGWVHSVHLENVTVQYIGGTGIDIRGFDSGVSNSVVHDVGCRGAAVHGGNATLLQPGNNYADHNTIYHFALLKRTYQAGIDWAGVNNTYRHNRISDSPHNCMLGGGNTGDGVNCLFEYNSFEDCAYEAADAGAFYTCGQQATAFVNRGNVLRHSSFRNMRNNCSGVQGRCRETTAVYLDDQISGWHVYNNSFCNCAAGIQCGGGSFNRIHHNYFERCDTAQLFDARGVGWQQRPCVATDACVPLHGCTCNPGGALHELHGPAGPRWATLFGGEMWPVLNDTRCVRDQGHFPCYTRIEDNSYCRVGKFISAPQRATDSWNAKVRNNTEVPCRYHPAAAVDSELHV